MKTDFCGVGINVSRLRPPQNRSLSPRLDCHRRALASEREIGRSAMALSTDPGPRVFRYADLVNFPDDNLRRELIDGELIVTACSSDQGISWSWAISFFV